MEKDLAKIAPNNIQAEQMILRAILINNRALYNINEFLLPEHFYEPLHGKIYKSINLIISKGISATVISLKNMLGNELAFEEIGGVDYLAKPTTLALSIVNVNEYGKIVYDLGARGTLSKGFTKLQTSIEESWTSISSAIKNKNSINGISSGLLDLDSKLGGFKNSDLIILAGRPSIGKTALGVNLAINACKYFLTKKNTKDNVVPSVGFFSLEMSSQQISTRILSIESEINSSALFNGKIDEQDVDKLKTVQDEIQKWNFFIDDAPAISISAIRSRARRLKRTHNLAILFVDY
ncbi:dnaB-like helicase N terminal domain protein [Orientia tsutsugamushi str. TA716]|uniref:DNA 5'-3' helicase n=1 Tax=Orientia tsutsugamushi str. TA716 TaxID=1359175 RepID=A0A0F3NTT4_ORITS|nr:dnaB-like helicase N terminal domain protein [Orientia tsutsugamushi str. TA716]KJV72368.1 dnaB-like helicase N terminal domain protein [Orientia tsutsugamushi str. TA716]